MFGWFEPKSPLTTDQRHWIGARFQWLRDEFGDETLLRPVVTPSDDFFPEPYSATEEGALTLLRRVCEYMNVDSARIELAFYESESSDVVVVAFNPHLNKAYALGLYQQEQTQIRITLEKSRLAEPQSVVATLAHELGHVHLLADGRYDENQPDHEPLTDLLTVFFGLGIFNANESIREVNWRSGNWSGWSVSNVGYLTMAEYAYGLARYASARGEFKPAWARFLRKDLQALLTMELKHLLEGTVPPCAASTKSIRGGKAVARNDGIGANTGSQDSSDLSAHGENGDVDETGESDLCRSSENPEDEYFTEGTMNAAQGDFQLAIEAFSQVLEIDPRDAEAWRCRADAHLKLKNFAQAVEDCTQSITLDPENKPARLCRALGNLWLRRYSDALQDVNRVKNYDVRDPMIYMLRGLAYFGLNQHHRAKSDLTLSIRYAPTWPENYLIRSEVFRAMNKDKYANSDINEATRRDNTLSDKTARAALLAEFPIPK